jgi:hypothetical protein
VDCTNLTGSAANFIEQEGAIALTAVRGVNVNVLHIACTSKSAVTDRGVLIFDQHNPICDFDLVVSGIGHGLLEEGNALR